MIAVSASQALAIAKTSGVSGEFVKSFKNGQELRRYVLNICGQNRKFEIRAFPAEHA